MSTIASTIEKNKKEQKTVYYFTVNGNVFEAHHFTGKNPTLEIKHNGISLGSISKQKAKSEFVVNSGISPMRVTAWLNAENPFVSTIKQTSNSIGLEIDGVPVQNTLDDPELHIKNGKFGYCVLFVVLLLKSVFTYYNVFQEYESHLDAAISCAIYFVPLVLALAAFANYARWITFALVLGIVLSLAEFIDYAAGILDAISYGGNAVTLLIWFIFRIMALYAFFNALKWKNKKRKASMPNAL